MDEPTKDPDDVTTTGPPRWVKVSAILAAVLALLLAVVLLAGGGHGPGRHTSGAVAVQATAGTR